MSFIAGKQGKNYEPGSFLAHEECTRETRQIAQNSALVQTADDGGKYVPMGTAYPTNDGNAIGIVYEDVDVTNGDMPGSVVTHGEVYENKLAITGANYNTVTLKNLVSPKAQGWQERSGTSPNYTYADSADTTVDTTKTYYLPDESHTEVSDYAAVLNPKAEGWYESDGGTGYVLSTDIEGDKTKTYYEKSDIRLASAAKTALAALGFTFMQESVATRPDWN